MKRIIAAAIIAASLVAIPAAAHADEYDQVAKVPAIAGYTGPAVFGLWPKTDDVATVLVYAPVDKRWGVERVARQWNKAGVIRFILVTTPCEGCVTVKQRPTYIHLADAAMYSVNGVMQRCDITLNMTYFESPVYNRARVAHEMAHCLGMDHSERSNTVIGTMSGLDGPTWRDLEWIKMLYGGVS